MTYLPLGCLAAALVVALAGGFLSGSMIAVILCAIGAIAGGYGVWRGMQAEKSTGMAMSMIAVVGNLALGGIELVLKIIHGVTH